ncbi:deoxyribodipyrimidine photo-lyase [Sphingomonas albertensis]|uniref:Deoxyribodipyrimidine photo-lyase n=1 Tax=Sphingomonas albertensis TaxID=2762591 RepID=A0ABR7AM84_9SPHN|nr:deoxyribodipyrimidine photo-lyase [Sphingomonas albertensis]MBC3941566.1 deoxyribodipyrimidine photo-lyase [Sphingomonas albertensis]
MPAPLPHSLSSWSEAPRVQALNAHDVRPGGRYVLCWLQQALRARDNPVIDAAIHLGNALGLPVLVYHGLREDYPYASDRLHHFILGASRDLARDCRQRGVACIQYVDRAKAREKGLVYRLAADSAAVLVEDQPTFVARWQSERFAERVERAVFAVNAACLVPPAVLGEGIGSTTAFRRRHQPVRSDWQEATDVVPTVAPYDGPLPYTPDRLDACSDADLDRFVAAAAIDHSVPVSPMFPAGREGALIHLERLMDTVLPTYAATRNDATNPIGASMLSPYLHFGVVGPREVMATVDAADAPAASKEKFADELLTWREWFHYQARALTAPERYDRIAGWAQETLEAHAGDPRPDIETLDALIHGETRDETWNACQRQFLIDGWMHNNLRMYWGKRIIAMTPDPQTAWATACYLNDRLSLDGRDPSTYGNIAATFGGGSPGRDGPSVYGKVPTRSDGSTRHRPGGPDWLQAAAARPRPDATVPDGLPTELYLTGKPPL